MLKNCAKLCQKRRMKMMNNSYLKTFINWQNNGHISDIYRTFIRQRCSTAPDEITPGIPLETRVKTRVKTRDIRMKSDEP